MFLHQSVGTLTVLYQLSFQVHLRNCIMMAVRRSRQSLLCQHPLGPDFTRIMLNCTGPTSQESTALGFSQTTTHYPVHVRSRYIIISEPIPIGEQSQQYGRQQHGPTRQSIRATDMLRALGDYQSSHMLQTRGAVRHPGLPYNQLFLDRMCRLRVRSLIRGLQRYRRTPINLCSDHIIWRNTLHLHLYK